MVEDRVINIRLRWPNKDPYVALAHQLLDDERPKVNKDGEQERVPRIENVIEDNRWIIVEGHNELGISMDDLIQAYPVALENQHRTLTIWRSLSANVDKGDVLEHTLISLSVVGEAETPKRLTVRLRPESERKLEQWTNHLNLSKTVFVEECIHYYTSALSQETGLFRDYTYSPEQMKAIGRRIRKYRTNRNWSQAELGERWQGRPKSTISNIERAKITLRPSDIKNLANNVFGIDPKNLDPNIEQRSD